MAVTTPEGMRRGQAAVTRELAATGSPARACPSGSGATDTWARTLFHFQTNSAPEFKIQNDAIPCLQVQKS
jgi:hypothetical protein